MVSDVRFGWKFSIIFLCINICFVLLVFLLFLENHNEINFQRDRFAEYQESGGGRPVFQSVK